MRIARWKIQSLPTTILIVVGLLVWVLTCGDVASAGTYAESAHGDPTSGVNRSGTPEDELRYHIGSCAHCHDTFDLSTCGVNNFMLFSTPLHTKQTEDFCFECHRAHANSVQVGMPQQFNYSRKFGGDTSIDCPSSIKVTFRFIQQDGEPRDDVCGSDNGSAHRLTSIRDFLQNRWGFGDTLDNINPCEGCHNPHEAQRHNYPVASKGTSPISLPSTHDDDWDVYGAETTERMEGYASPYTYQAPAYYGGGYEPEGNATNNGSNMPDYVTLCTGCHNATNTIYSPVQGRNLRTIDWDNEKHGKGNADEYITVDSPYTAGDEALGYVLSCLDCHEPHGSPNAFLIREVINGAALGGSITRSSTTEWHYLCDRCHQDDLELSAACVEDQYYMSHHSSSYDRSISPHMCHRTGCHGSGGFGTNCTTDGGRAKLGCIGCHYHGSFKDDCDYEPYTRLTF